MFTVVMDYIPPLLLFPFLTFLTNHCSFSFKNWFQVALKNQLNQENILLIIMIHHLSSNFHHQINLKKVHRRSQDPDQFTINHLQQQLFQLYRYHFLLWKIRIYYCNYFHQSYQNLIGQNSLILIILFFSLFRLPYVNRCQSYYLIQFMLKLMMWKQENQLKI